MRIATGLAGGCFCERRALLTSELAMYLQVFAGCLSERLLPGDTKRSIWPILLLLQQPEFKSVL